jgi:hypothetical protein
MEQHDALPTHPVDALDEVVISESRVGYKNIIITRDASGDLWVSSQDNTASFSKEISYAIDMKEVETEVERYERMARAEQISQSTLVSAIASNDENADINDYDKDHDQAFPIPTGIVYLDDSVEVRVECEGNDIYSIEVLCGGGREYQVVDSPGTACVVRDDAIRRFATGKHSWKD